MSFPEDIIQKFGKKIIPYRTIIQMFGDEINAMLGLEESIMEIVTLSTVGKLTI